MSQGVHCANLTNIVQTLETDISKLASVLENDFSLLLSEMANDIASVRQSSGNNLPARSANSPPTTLASTKPITDMQGSSGTRLDLSSLPRAEQPYARMIADAFAIAGYGKVQQAAAVANAIAESSLNPTAVGDGGNSWGLFQDNQDGGLGAGLSAPALKIRKQHSVRHNN